MKAGGFGILIGWSAKSSKTKGVENEKWDHEKKFLLSNSDPEMNLKRNLILWHWL